MKTTIKGIFKLILLVAFTCITLTRGSYEKETDNTHRNLLESSLNTEAANKKMENRDIFFRPWTVDFAQTILSLPDKSAAEEADAKTITDEALPPKESETEQAAEADSITEPPMVPATDPVPEPLTVPAADPAPESAPEVPAADPALEPPTVPAADPAPESAPAVPPVPTSTPAPAVTEVSETVYALTDVNVRSGYSADTSRIGGLAKGSSATRTGILDNGWSRIDYNGSFAYISSQYLSTTAPAPEPIVQEPAVPAVQDSKTAVISEIGNLIGNFEMDSDIEEHTLHVLRNELQKIPSNLRNAFKNRSSGSNILVLTKSISTSISKRGVSGQASGSTIGSFYGAPGKTYIFYLADSQRLPLAVAHEFGHYLDYHMCLRSNFVEFLDIYEKEKGNYVATDGSSGNSAYDTTNSLDFFAGVFQNLINGTNTQNTPEATAYVRRQLDSCTNFGW